MSSVTAGGPGLVAAGSAVNADAAVWTSVGGVTWSRAVVDTSQRPPTPTASAWAEFQAALRDVGQLDAEFGLHYLWLSA